MGFDGQLYWDNSCTIQVQQPFFDDGSGVLWLDSTKQSKINFISATNYTPMAMATPTIGITPNGHAQAYNNASQFSTTMLQDETTCTVPVPMAEPVDNIPRINLDNGYISEEVMFFFPLTLVT